MTNVAKAKPKKNVERRSGRPTKEAGRPYHRAHHRCGDAAVPGIELRGDQHRPDCSDGAGLEANLYARFAPRRNCMRRRIRKSVNNLLVPAVAEFGRDGAIDRPW